MIKHIVFDIGNVLIGWDLWPIFGDQFETRDQMQDWLRDSQFLAFNEYIDLGRPEADLHLIAQQEFGAYADAFCSYIDRTNDSLVGAIEGSWRIMDALRQDGYDIFGLSNWGEFSWARAIQKFPQLDSAFDHLVTSGRTKLIKPDPAIYHELIAQTGAKPDACLFIDDRADNVHTAMALGWQAIQFHDPQQLADALHQRGILQRAHIP